MGGAGKARRVWSRSTPAQPTSLPAPPARSRYGGLSAFRILASAAGSGPRHFLLKAARSDPAAPTSKQELKMYTPPMFKPDRAASLAFAQERGFGTFCAWDGTKPVA